MRIENFFNDNENDGRYEMMLNSRNFEVVVVGVEFKLCNELDTTY